MTSNATAPFEFQDWAAATAAWRAMTGDGFPDVDGSHRPMMARRMLTETPDGTVRIDHDPACRRALRSGDDRVDSGDRWDALRSIPTPVIHGALSRAPDHDIVARMKAAQAGHGNRSPAPSGAPAATA